MNMKYLLILTTILLFVLLLTLPILANGTRGTVLFDEGHAEDAGNADWVTEGAYSDYADLLRAHGYVVKGTSQPLTPELLRNIDALVIAEPNSIFTQAEQDAIIQFIQNGGGAFFVGNHIESDRNQDGIDSVGVYNQFVHRLGFRFEDADFLEANLSAEPVAGEYKAHPVTYNVTEMAIWSGTSIEVHDPENVQGLIFFNKWRYGQPALAIGTFGEGRFVAVGDSAIFDDGTGTSEKNLHGGYEDFDHKQLSLNVINWLLDFPAEDY